MRAVARALIREVVAAGVRVEDYGGVELADGIVADGDVAAAAAAAGGGLAGIHAGERVHERDDVVEDPLAHQVFELAERGALGLIDGLRQRLFTHGVQPGAGGLDGIRYVTWSAIDDQRARAILRLRGYEVSAVFHFGPDGMPERITANRYRDVNGKGVLTPWTGLPRDFRAVAGLRVPCEIEIVWELESGPFPCIRFTVEDIQIERQ